MLSKMRLIIGGLIVFVLVLSSGTAQLVRETSNASDSLSSAQPVPEASKTNDDLIVHEWGTFTSVAGRDGSAVKWQVLSSATDLPGFVYTSLGNSEGVEIRNSKKCIKCQTEATVRMETPVLYFYTDRETDVSVRVDFPDGRITEWYPQASTIYRTLDWGRIKVMPGAAVNFPSDKSANHYYAARNTDAAPLQVRGRLGEQYEKFLFYRGIGNLDVPLSVRLEGEQIGLKNMGREKIERVILFENREGRSGYQLCDLSSGSATVNRPALTGSMENLTDELKRILVAEGLYEKEAEAMIETWRDLWFEEGLRAFYIFPPKATDSTLPLTLDPKPSKLVRVMVGRVEVITPELESSAEKILATIKNIESDLPFAAKELAQKQGRFAVSALKRILERPGDLQDKKIIMQLIHFIELMPFINV